MTKSEKKKLEALIRQWLIAAKDSENEMNGEQPGSPESSKAFAEFETYKQCSENLTKLISGFHVTV